MFGGNTIGMEIGSRPGVDLTITEDDQANALSTSHKWNERQSRPAVTCLHFTQSGADARVAVDIRNQDRLALVQWRVECILGIRNAFRILNQPVFWRPLSANDDDR